MKHPPHVYAQRGATLVVALIMLVLITLVVASNFTLSTTNLKAVGNMQFRDEAIAAANKAIEQKMSTPFTDPPLTTDSINVDIDNNGTTDYVVSFAAPTCIRSSQVTGSNGSGHNCSVDLPWCTGASDYYYDTVWDLDATVTDQNSGASVHVRQGVHVLLNQTQVTSVCS